jgi:peptidyl-prolyl cis-trans isomerase D
MEEAKAAAEKLAPGATPATTFEALAAERGLKESDIDLGTVAKTAWSIATIADAAFALKSGEVSAPVEGRFGIAIVKVDAIEAGKTRPFEEVSAELKRDMQNERAKNEITNVQEKIEDERLGGATLADAARKFNLTPRVIEAIDRNGKDATAIRSPTCPERRRAVRGLRRRRPRRERAAAAAEQRRLCLVRRRCITPARDAARRGQGQGCGALARRRDAPGSATKATEMLDKIKAGTSFADVAAADKLKVEWRPGFKRGAPPTGLSPAAVAEVFQDPAGSARHAEGASPTERMVFRVTEIKVPPLDPEAADVKRIDEALRPRTTEDLIAQYLTPVQSEIGVTDQCERAEPGQWRRHAELMPPCRSSHGRRLRRALRPGRSAGAVDHARSPISKPRFPHS